MMLLKVAGIPLKIDTLQKWSKVHDRIEKSSFYGIFSIIVSDKFHRDLRSLTAV